MKNGTVIETRNENIIEEKQIEAKAEAEADNKSDVRDAAVDPSTEEKASKPQRPEKKRKAREPLPPQSRFVYGLARFISILVSKIAFQCKLLRNEIKGKKGPFVIIANHEAALDFVNLIGATTVPMTFVVSNSFYNTLPLKKAMDSIGVIPKQQFQTSLRDLAKMKRVIEEGRILVIYPAGLMCEDGRSTPIPVATYEFLKWLKTDIYMARTSGTYFSMPKWSSGIRRGKTFMDIYKLFDKEDIAEMDIYDIKDKTDKALEFDAYREQEILHIRYTHNDHIDGLENVLYMCPNCHSEFTMKVENHNVITCTNCGFAEKSDEYAFLHKISEEGDEIRYVSTWSKRIYNNLRRQIGKKRITELSSKVEIQMLPKDKSKFSTVGEGELRITEDKLYLTGTNLGEELSLALPTSSYASLPFKPGKYIEVQHGNDIFRCLPEDGRIVMKMINMIKIFYELNTAKRTIDQLTGKKKRQDKENKPEKEKKPNRAKERKRNRERRDK